MVSETPAALELLSYAHKLIDKTNGVVGQAQLRNLEVQRFFKKRFTRLKYVDLIFRKMCINKIHTNKQGG